MRLLDVSPRVTLPVSSGSRIGMFNLLSRISRRPAVRQFSQALIRDLRRPGFATEVQMTPACREYRWQGFVSTSLCVIPLT